MGYKDVKRVDGSPTLTSPVPGGWPSSRQPPSFADQFLVAGGENDCDLMSPGSASNHSLINRHCGVATSCGNDDDGGESNFNVVIRVRPPVPRELDSHRQYVDVVRTAKDRRSITLCETLDTEDCFGGVYSRQTFTFDYVYDSETQQRHVYEHSAQPAVLSVLQGYNATLMAYGQTGTGKTYTMEGFTSEEHRGIIPRAVEEVFTFIDRSRQENMRFLVRASYMQIYNEVISDLLKPSSGKPLVVRNTPQRGVYIDGLSEWVVRSPNDVYSLIERGTTLRAKSSTKLSELSSRSHAMFTIIVEVIEGDETNPVSYRVGKLNIVDLAGSEKVRQAGVTGQRLEETKKINKSLHELGNVISALASKNSGRSRHVPFRNSVLTSALRDSLGGNCKTTLIACISPALESYNESLSTLVFANRAKNIKNTAFINEDLDQAALLRKYEQELKKLRQQLQERESVSQLSGNGVDFGVLSELRQGMRRAEEDREAALEALQQSSRAHQQELAVRKRFEERIRELEKALQNGCLKKKEGGDLTASDEYALRLDELDRERQVMEEDKAQVDRYKQLLLKQRDIMLNLTTRLNERDETILQLQEEVDAYDAHVQTLENTLETLQQQQQQQRLNGGSQGKCLLTSQSKAQAEEFIRQARVPSRGDGGEVRYRSAADPSLLITAEEKMVELLLANHHSLAVTQIDDEMKHQLTELVRKRAEKVVQLQLNERFWQQHCELEFARTQLLQCGQKQDALEQLLAAAKVPQSMFQEGITRTQRHIDEQQEKVRKTYEGRIETLQKQLAQEREKHMQFMNQLDMLALESRKALECCTNAAQRVKINDVCIALTQLEAHIFTETRRTVEAAFATRFGVVRNSIDVKSDKDHHNNNNNNNNNNKDICSVIGSSSNNSSLCMNNGNDHTFAFAATAVSSSSQSSSSHSLLSPSFAKATTESVQNEFEKKLQTLQCSHAKEKDDWRRMLREKDAVVRELEKRLHDAHAGINEEVASLTKSLNTHKKDRSALQTIMKQRIKVKIDTICELLAAGPQLTPQERSRLCGDAHALQNLVNASIKAMES